MAFSKIKNYWHRETTLDPPPPPPHLCVLKRGCRKHNTNGSGITLNIQMGKLIVYAWIHHCDYLAPLASLLSPLKATQSAFCFHFVPFKSLGHTMRSSRREFRPINVISSALTTCDYWVECKGGSNTLSEERVSNDKRQRCFYHLTAAANKQHISDFYTNAVNLCMFLSVHLFKSKHFHLIIFAFLYVFICIL